MRIPQTSDKINIIMPYVVYVSQIHKHLFCVKNQDVNITLQECQKHFDQFRLHQLYL